MAAIVVFSRSPDMLSAETIIRTFRLSSAAPRVSESRRAESIRPCRMSVKVDRRILRRLHHVRRHDERRVRAIVENARRRELGRHAAARTDLRRSRRARFAGRDRRAASTTAAALAATAGGRLLPAGGLACEKDGAQTC